MDSWLQFGFFAPGPQICLDIYNILSEPLWFFRVGSWYLCHGWLGIPLHWWNTSLFQVNLLILSGTPGCREASRSEVKCLAQGQSKERLFWPPDHEPGYTRLAVVSRTRKTLCVSTTAMIAQIPDVSSKNRQFYRPLAEQITIRLPAPPMTNGNDYEKTFALKLFGSPHALSFQYNFR
jgi:hypothetical protein